MSTIEDCRESCWPTTQTPALAALAMPYLARPLAIQGCAGPGDTSRLACNERGRRAQHGEYFSLSVLRPAYSDSLSMKLANLLDAHVGLDDFVEASLPRRRQRQS